MFIDIEKASLKYILTTLKENLSEVMKFLEEIFFS